MKRTWYRQQSDGRYFRNCPLILSDMKRPANRRRRRQKELNDEWERAWRDGVIWADSIPDGDEALPYDDSKEATDAWVTRVLSERPDAQNVPSGREGRALCLVNAVRRLNPCFLPVLLARASHLF